MTGFIPKQDPRLQNNGFQMVRVRGKELPGSLVEVPITDSDYSAGYNRITFRSTAVDVGDAIEVVGVGFFTVTKVYDPYRTNPGVDRSMHGRYIAAVANRKED
jgi:hypothetical protein